MKIRTKILLYYSSTVISLTIISAITVYVLFSEYREEEFQQKQKDKVNYTIGLISDYENIGKDLSKIIDMHLTHEFYDEKILIYDKNKKLIYKSIDDLPILDVDKLLNSLSTNNRWIENQVNKYDIIALYTPYQNEYYYAISKAFDTYGYNKLFYLRNMLIAISILISIIVLLISIYISKRISKPLTNLAEQLSRLDFTNQNIPALSVDSKSHEIIYLTQKFNQLIKRTNEAFTFQKHSIQHISHQLKTPIAVLVSELEQIEKSSNTIELKLDVRNQIVRTKSLGNIINALLEISKVESGQQFAKHVLRIDEILFDLITEFNIIYPDFKFEINYSPEEFSEHKLHITANLQLVKQAFHNILSNCIAYSDNLQANILFDCTDPEKLKILVSNYGKAISSDEVKFLFDHFFRGKNSTKKNGFGLGLVLSKKVFDMHGAHIAYSNPFDNLNIFEVSFLYAKF